MNHNFNESKFSQEDMERLINDSLKSHDTYMQLLRDCLRELNNISPLKSKALTDRIKEFINRNSDMPEAEQLKQSKENQGWEDQRQAMFNASNKKP